MGKGWINNPIVRSIVSVALGAIIGSIITGTYQIYIYNKQKAELNSTKMVVEDKNLEIAEFRKELRECQKKMPEMPVTVVDPATGNQLYIGRPIGKELHYEFPITLNDGQGSYRIDQYRLLNEFEGKLIILRKK
ncbi:hypothetical protein ACFL1K_01730 [Candidatus Omnitrophota bacterium]